MLSIWITGSISEQLTEADDFMQKWSWHHVHEKWHPIPLFCAVGEEISCLLFCVCFLNDDVTYNDGAWYFVENCEKRPNSWKLCCWLAGFYSYIKIYALLVMLMSRLSPVVVFRLGKNRGKFSKWRLTCTPVSFCVWLGNSQDAKLSCHLILERFCPCYHCVRPHRDICPVWLSWWHSVCISYHSTSKVLSMAPSSKLQSLDVTCLRGTSWDNDSSCEM